MITPHQVIKRVKAVYDVDYTQRQAQFALDLQSMVDRKYPNSDAIRWLFDVTIDSDSPETFETVNEAYHLWLCECTGEFSY